VSSNQHDLITQQLMLRYEGLAAFRFFKAASGSASRTGLHPDWGGGIGISGIM